MLQRYRALPAAWHLPLPIAPGEREKGGAESKADLRTVTSDLVARCPPKAQSWASTSVLARTATAGSAPHCWHGAQWQAWARYAVQRRDNASRRTFILLSLRAQPLLCNAPPQPATDTMSTALMITLIASLGLPGVAFIGEEAPAAYIILVPPFLVPPVSPFLFLLSQAGDSTWVLKSAAPQSPASTPSIRRTDPKLKEDDRGFTASSKRYS